jgi:hypothetical protein
MNILIHLQVDVLRRELRDARERLAESQYNDSSVFDKDTAVC